MNEMQVTHAIIPSADLILKINISL